MIQKNLEVQSSLFVGGQTPDLDRIYDIAKKIWNHFN